MNTVQSVLVVDDDHGNRAVFRDLLSFAGYEVIEASDGGTALHLIGTRSPPSVVLLDLMMPDVDGVDVLRAIRADDRWHAVPVVVCSGFAADGIPGAFRCIRKPCTTTQVLEAVRAAVNFRLALL